MREKESPALKQIVSFDGDTLFQIVCKLTFFFKLSLNRFVNLITSLGVSLSTLTIYSVTLRRTIKDATPTYTARVNLLDFSFSTVSKHQTE